jgi:uncharacterized sulfatase
MRLWIIATFAALASAVTPACAAPAASPAAATAKQRPNVIFVLIDDMGSQDLSCFGGTRVKTPEIDRLASEGMRFQQFYVSAPICSPSRVALTTGQFPQRWSVTSYLDNRDNNARRGMKDWLDPAAPSLARHLHDAGYHTAHVGKWHMGGQRDVADAPMITAYGFDTSITNFEGLGPRILAKFPDKPDGTPFRHGPTDMSAKHGVGPITWVDRHRVTEAFVDHAIEQVKVARKQDKPFYINLWPDDVHSPCFAPPGMQGDGSPAANYLGVLREADKQLGRIFDLVRSDPALRDNTVIVLCSDNGHENGLGSSGELRGSKGQLYEGGIRSNLIVWYPGGMDPKSRGTVNDKSVITGVDFLPSVLGLAKLPAAKASDGEDLSDVLTGRKNRDRSSPALWLRPPDRPGPKNAFPDVAIRDGKWKLVAWRDGSRPAELYDIPADPNEKSDLAQSHPDVANRLKKQVLDWDRSTGSKQ